MIRWLGIALVRWVGLVVRNPRTTLSVLVVITAIAGWIAVDRYAMNSRLGDLVEQNADWRVDYEAFQAAFPQLVETALVVVSGSSFTQVEEAALRLEQAIASYPDRYVDVYAPANEAFFRDNALLFMDLDQLYEVSDALAEAQPMLTAVAADPGLRGVLNLIDGALANDAPAGFDSVLDKLVRSAQSAAAGADPTIRWGDEFFAGDLHYRIIFLRGQQNYGASLPNAEVVRGLRDIIAATPVGDEVSVKLTGEVALRHEEVEAAVGGVQIAGTLALLLLGGVLAFGVRSARIVVATFVMLLVGVVWTSAWAMLAVGSYNTLSLVFLVMFFGLGVDFCVHYCLRVQEALARNGQGNLEMAFTSATRSVGGAIALCTVTTAIGFLGFVPTAYKGLADLGVISAGGMLIACVLTFTLLPALFATFGAPKARSLELPGGARAITGLLRYRKPVLVVLLALVVVSGYLLPRLQFDYSVLALRDPSAESMQTLRELQREQQITDYALYALAAPDEVETHKALKRLASVERVTTPFDYVPVGQEDKLYALEDLEALLGSALEPAMVAGAASVEQLRGSMAATQGGIADALVAGGVGEERAALLRALQDQLVVLTTAPDEVVLAWQGGVVDNLLHELEWLRRAITASEVRFADLPAGLKARLVAPDGRYLSAILPAKDIAPVAALTEFIDSVRGELDAATGRPVVEWGVGNIVVASFQTALLVALIGISLVLLIVLRSARDTVLVLTPLLLTGLFTTATVVLLGVPVNMASVLVLPLIFGLGVDNGIHMVERYHDFPMDSTGAASPDGMRQSSCIQAHRGRCC